MLNEQSKLSRHPDGQQVKFSRRPIAKWIQVLAVAGAAGPLMTSVAVAQEQAVTEEVIVMGSRQITRSQIEIKRDATSIVDGLSSAEIGGLPALSIGEALESITGVASHRENGGATEISIRGMGPFLGQTTFNGREATNGSGDRSVNFSQFPSELMSKIAVYKTQDASLIEGGVSGLVQLETLRPLDSSERSIRINAKANMNPYNENTENSLQGDIGFRGTASYIDQFEFDNGAMLGVSIGLQTSDLARPEAEYRSSSPSGTSLFACINDPNQTNEGFWRSASGDCEDQVSGSSNQGYNTAIDPETGVAVSDGIAYAWTGSSRGYRQNETSEERDAYFAAIQFQPNEDWDINLDVEISERVESEDRHDILFGQKRATPGITGQQMEFSPTGVITEWAGSTYIDSQGELFSRTEDYKGGGLNISHNVNDRLTIEADLSFSQTNREELQITHRARATEGSLVTWTIPGEIPQFTVENVDLTDESLFTGRLYSRADRENVRENTVTAARVDFEYELSDSGITSIEGGVRSSTLEYLQWGGNNGAGARNTYEGGADFDPAATVAACVIDFPEQHFLNELSSGNLITNVDENGNVLEGGTGNAFVAFRNQCMADQLSAGLLEPGEDFYPEVSLESVNAIDVTEETLALFAMANYETSFMDRNLRGSFGVRVVDTEVTSVGYRNEYTIETSPSGTLSILELDNQIRVEGGGSYTEVLPSVSFVWDLEDDLLVRGGLFRGISRTDPRGMGYQRTFSAGSADDAEDATTIEDLLSGASGPGNPNAQPFGSWNTDVSVEWYPNDDAMLAVGLYHKRFTGGYENQTVLEDFVIDGQVVSLPITNQVTTDQSSDLYGIEISGSYHWDTGIGVNLSYNNAKSNFEFEDSLYGNTYETDLDGNTTQLTAGIIQPGNIPGFSENVFSGKVYYQIGDFDISAIYKYRSEYFQPYTTNGTRLRYVGDVGVWEMRVSYDVNDYIEIKLEGINLFSEPKQQYFFSSDNLGEMNDYGPRFFAGVTAKF